MATLVVHTQGTLVEARGHHLRLATPDGLSTELPLVGIDRLHAYGKVQITTQALAVLAEAGKEVAWFSRGGRLRARLAVNGAGGGVALRRAQYRLADETERILEFAQRLVAAKLHNQRAVLLRAWRQREDLKEEALLTQWGQRIDEIDLANGLETLRGLEGATALAYFPRWAACCGSTFPWNGRNRRPPRDPLNVLLSFGYTLLANEVQAQIEAAGLDPWLGFFHAERPGHAALASDLMEPLRPMLVDRLTLDLAGHQRLTWRHFENHRYEPRRDPDSLDDADPGDEAPSDPVEVPRLTDDGRKVFLTAWERRLAHEDADDGTVKGGRALIAEQVQSFARSLRHQDPALYVPVRLRT
jgi:CRISPR-associated protein Cas1